MKRVFLFFFFSMVALSLLADNRTITYTADAQLVETTVNTAEGLYANAFAPRTITSHTFSDGVGTITFNGDVTAIGDYAFFNCSITSITLPSSVVSLGTYAFGWCSSMTSIDLPSGIRTMGDYSFYYCSKLASITLPSALTSISKGLFYYCGAIKGTVTIPSGVTSIGSSAFYGTSIDRLEVPASVTTIGSSAFGGGVYNVIYEGTATGTTWGATLRNAYEEGCLAFSDSEKTNLIKCKSSCAIGDIVVPNGVTTIAQAAFKNCTKITSITLPNTITSIGNEAFRSCTQLASINCPGGLGGTIGNYVFSGDTMLTSISFSDQLTGIGNYAFENCKHLESVTFADGASGPIGEYAFSKCPITSIVLSSGITSIGKCAFLSCGRLESVIIPENSVLTTIGSSAFKYCSSLTSITIPESVTTIGGSAFEGCRSLNSVTIPENSVLTTIGSSAFNYCSSLTSITIPESVTTIGGSAFEGCSSLNSVTIPENSALTYIDQRVFYGCSLTSITIPESVTAIHSSAFDGCSSLNSVTIPENSALTSIGERAFFRCSLTSITIPESVTTIGSYAFYDCPFFSVTVPNSVTRIGSYAFYGTKALFYHGSATGSPWSAQILNAFADGYIIYTDETKTTLIFCDSRATGEITLPASVTAINSSAFLGCTGLTSVSLPEGITSLGASAFRGCTGLTSITIPSTVTKFNDYTFEGCTALTSVTCLPTTPPSKSYTAFLNVPSSITIYVPNGKVAAYKNSWNGMGLNDFRPILPITVTVVPSNIEFGTTTGSGTYNYHDTITISATDNYGYHFVQWSDRSTDNPHAVVVEDDITYRASYTENLYTVSLLCDETMGSVSGAGTVRYKREIRINAMANEGHHFVEWSDGSTSSAHDVTVLGDTTLTAIFARNVYGVNLYTNNSGWGTVSGKGSFLYHDTITISATPNYGYHFVKWSDGSTESERTFVINSSVMLTATFAKNTYTITPSCDPVMGSVSGGGSDLYLNTVAISATPNYGYHFVEWSDGSTSASRTVTVRSDSALVATFTRNSYTVGLYSVNTAWGSVSGNGTFLYHDTISISATPYYGYHFARWSDGNTDNPRSIVVAEDESYYAYFEKNSYTISLSCDEIMGSVAGGKSDVYLSTVAIMATPNYGYHFVEWSDGNTDSERTLTIERDSALVASFAKNAYTLSTSAGVGGTVSTGGTALYQETITISATADYGYHFVEWSDGNTNETRSVEMTRDSALLASFAKNSYALSVYVNNMVMGQVFGSGSALYQESLTISALANYGYHFVEWSDGNTDNPRLVEMTCDSALVAMFAKNSYTLTTAAGEGGSVSAGGTALYQETIEITATADEGYHFVKWSDGNTTNPRVVTMTQDLALTAEFAKNSYTLTTAAQTGGAVSAGGTALYQETIEITATADEGYHFVKWSDGNTTNPRVVTMTQDFALTAEFAKNSYTLTTAAQTGGAVSAGGTALYQETIEITATADEGYHFVKWNDGNTTNPRVVTMTQNLALTAEFAKNSYTLTTNAQTGGAVSAGGTALYQETIEITATADEGYHFVKWNDGNTTNPRVVTMTENLTLTAEFAKNSYTLTTAAGEGGSVSEGGTALYQETIEISATADEGYHFVEWSDGNTENPRTVVMTADITLTAEFEEDMPQGMSAAVVNESAIKVLIDNQVFIQRGDHLYDLRGQEVK